jgi:hypothetical protein
MHNMRTDWEMQKLIGLVLFATVLRYRWRSASFATITSNRRPPGLSI